MLLRTDGNYFCLPLTDCGERFDVSIRVVAGKPRDSSVTTRKTASYRNLPVAAPSYLAEHGTPGMPAGLIKHARFGFTGCFAWPDWPLTKEDKRHTVRPACSVVADHSEVLRMAGMDEAGITFTAACLAGPALREGKLAEVLPGWGAGRMAGSTPSCYPDL